MVKIIIDKNNSKLYKFKMKLVCSTFMSTLFKEMMLFSSSPTLIALVLAPTVAMVYHTIVGVQMIEVNNINHFEVTVKKYR